MNLTKIEQERYHFFRRFHDLKEADYQLLTDSLKTQIFKKGDVLTVPGQVPKELYFIKSGVLMSYYGAEDKMYVLSFSHFPHVCAIAESFSFQLPSKYFLVCLTESELDYISHEHLQQLIDVSQPLERLFRRMTESMLSELMDIHIELRAMSIKERFQKFCSTKPQLLQFVPHKYIASYLGIDPTNFSRLFNSVKF